MPKVFYGNKLVEFTPWTGVEITDDTLSCWFHEMIYEFRTFVNEQIQDLMPGERKEISDVYYLRSGNRLAQVQCDYTPGKGFEFECLSCIVTDVLHLHS